MLFRDRAEAGQALAAHLGHLREAAPLLVLGLPRGGVPVALEVALTLRAPLDVCMVRKLGVPTQPELGMGAIGEDGTRVLNSRVLAAAGVSEAELAAAETRERGVLEQRAALYRGDRAPAEPAGRIVVIVDDGVATGSTALVACQVVRARGAGRVVVAVPVAPPGWTRSLGDAADEYVCPHTPEGFFSVGQFYTDFAQTEDADVIAALERAAEQERAAGRGETPEGAGRAGSPAVSDHSGGADGTDPSGRAGPWTAS